MSPPEPKEFLPGVPDWSTVHEPSGDLFKPITDKDDWSKLMWTEEQINKFWTDGLVTNIPLLSEEQCNRIINDYKYFTGEVEHPGMDMMYEYHSNQSGDPNNVLIHCLGHWRLTSLFHDLPFLPQIVVPASQLLVPDKQTAVRFWHDQLFAKPAKHGGVVAWHQDYSYWIRTRPMMHLTVHVALDDQSEENGGIYYIPKSHTWTRDGEPLPVLDFNFKDMESIKTILTEEELSQFKPVCARLKKGEASFHHPLTVHGSYSNRSDRPRRSAVLNYFGDGVYSDSNEELLKGSIVPKGQKMEGQFFPVVFDPAWMK